MATAQPAETTALCPVCRAPMQRTPVPGVEATIDTCFHGTWFDARELRIFAEALKLAAQPRATSSLPAISLDPPGSSGFDDLEAVGDTIGFVVDLLSLLFGD